MNTLAGLRLNCLLVPIVLVAVALAATWTNWWLASRTAADLERQDACLALDLAAHLDPTGDLTRIRNADPRWLGLAIVDIERGKLVQLRRDGVLDLAVDNPHPDLVLATNGPMAWTEGRGLIAAAAPLRSGDDVALLYGEREEKPLEFTVPAVISGVLILFGSALGWYLSARIYTPVEWLTREADAALSGKPQLPGERTSKETAAMRSSIITLADRYRSGTHLPTRAAEDSGASA